MSDFTQIKTDCEQVADGIEKLVVFMERNRDLYADDPDSAYYDPDWVVCYTQDEHARLLTSLNSIRGLVWHLAHNPEAAAHLIQAHMAAEGGA